MLTDIPIDKKFEDVFTMYVIWSGDNEHESHVKEQQAISMLNTTNPQKGYNTLKGHPSTDKKFWTFRAVKARKNKFAFM